MLNTEIITEILNQIDFAIKRIISTCENINDSDDFALSNDGMLRLESSCMLLSTIGESVKNLNKHTEGKLLKHYKSIDWKKLMGTRDIIVHHYFDIDREIVFNIVKNKLPELQEVIEQIIKDIKNMI